MKAVFFDRDGIVNLAPPEGGYVLSPEAFHLEPVFPELLGTVTRLGYAAVVVTNQRCIARGLVSTETVAEIHAQMQRRLRVDFGLTLLDVMTCPHHPGECACRKPLPGMLLEAARRHGIDLAQSWMVGDRMTDITAGHRAGCRTILVNAALDAVSSDLTVRPDVVCRTLKELFLQIELLLCGT